MLFFCSSLCISRSCVCVCTRYLYDAICERMFVCLFVLVKGQSVRLLTCIVSRSGMGRTGWRMIFQLPHHHDASLIDANECDATKKNKGFLFSLSSQSVR